MIELTPLARPYAKAMFASAHESNKLDQIAKELNISHVEIIKFLFLKSLEYEK